MADPFDVQPAGGDVGGDQHGNLVVLEPVELGDSGGLFHVAMDLTDREARALEAGVKLADGGLAVGEHDRVLELFAAQDVAKNVAFLVAAHFDDLLVDVDVGGRRTRHFDRLGVAQEFRRELLDWWWHGRREQQGLALLGQARSDFLDIGDEPHVEHPVGFVDHQEVAAVQQDLAAAEQVHQPAGCRDQDVDALFKRLHLVAHLNAADQQRHRKLVIFAVFLEILRNLRRKFAGRLKDQASRHPRPASAMTQNIDHREDKGGGLAGSGLGDPDQILAHQDCGDCLGLDGRRLVVAAIADGAQQFVGKAEVGKIHNRMGVPEIWGWRRIRATRVRDCASIGQKSRKSP